ncbi:MAG: GTPase Era, partial [Rikenellaceae bacterium]|nr:GTPase Era [Rikenellaceae bacterium]
NGIVALLAEGQAYHPNDTLTDTSLSFFASDIIREKILLNYDKEIPYSTEVAIESYEESPMLDRINAVIYVARQSQKGIIIGHQGSKLKRVGTEARKDLEAFLDKKVFLEIFVKVADDWRNNDRALRQFGYNNE